MQFVLTDTPCKLGGPLAQSGCRLAKGLFRHLLGAFWISSPETPQTVVQRKSSALVELH